MSVYFLNTPPATVDVQESEYDSTAATRKRDEKSVPVKKISKTERILAIYHLLMSCSEVSYKEVTDLIPVSNKTVARDIRILAQAGCAVEFVKERRVYKADARKQPLQLPERRNERLYIQKIARLMTIMSEMEYTDDPIEWYGAKFPDLNVRTRQRDFKILNNLGYCISREDDPYNREGRPLGKHYCDWKYWPPGPYALDVFNRK